MAAADCPAISSTLKAYTVYRFGNLLVKFPAFSFVKKGENEKGKNEEKKQSPYSGCVTYS